MRRLDKARGNLKHAGILPSKIEIEGFRASVTNFFYENCSLVFKIEFNSISLVHLIQCQESKEALEKAELLITTGNNDDALCNIALSFKLLIDDYEKKKKSFNTRNN